MLLGNSYESFRDASVVFWLGSLLLAIYEARADLLKKAHFFSLLIFFRLQICSHLSIFNILLIHFKLLLIKLQHCFQAHFLSLLFDLLNLVESLLIDCLPGVFLFTAFRWWWWVFGEKGNVGGVVGY